MIHWSFLLAAEAAEAGGMFDFDATLPLMALQFVVLVIVLDKIFYKPLGHAIDERAEYVRQKTQDSKERLEKANAIAAQYEQELVDVRRQSQEIIAAAQAEAQEVVAKQVQAAQQEVQQERETAAREIEAQKVQAFSTLEGDVDALSWQILEKLLGSELAR
ncbi:MAG: F0F1 ATP synthase subunit B' [Spirulina sp.]